VPASHHCAPRDPVAIANSLQPLQTRPRHDRPERTARPFRFTVHAAPLHRALGSRAERGHIGWFKPYGGRLTWSTVLRTGARKPGACGRCLSQRGLKPSHWESAPALSSLLFPLANRLVSRLPLSHRFVHPHSTTKISASNRHGAVTVLDCTEQEQLRSVAMYSLRHSSKIAKSDSSNRV
jgi:hypothetical protein